MEIWGYNYDRDTQEMIFQGLQTVPNCNQQVRLLREDNGKVYMYVDSSVNDCFEAGQHKDVLLYDFSKNVGESYETMYCLPYLGGNVFWAASIYFNYKLNRVYNAEGEIIYRGEDIDTSTLSVGRIMIDAMSLAFTDGAVRAAGSGEVSLSLYDINGSVVATTTASDRAEIATSMLAPGIYIAVCKTAGGSKTIRIII